MIRRAISKVLAASIIGRPCRKFLHMVGIALAFLARRVPLWTNRLPYVKKLETQLHPEEAEKALKFYRNLRGYLEMYPIKPKISVLIPVYRPKIQHLRECLESVCVQIYPNWEVCLVDDCSERPEVTALIREFSERYPGRFKTAVNEANLHISRTGNRCLELASGDYIALLDHDDRLYPNALAEFVRHLNLHPKSEVFYSDERVIDEDGERIGGPFYKPKWSPFFHRSVNYTTHLSFYKIDLARTIKGFRQGYEGSQDHDFMLRAVEDSSEDVIHIPFCLYQWRAHAESTAHSLDAKPYAVSAGERSVKDHLDRLGREATVTYEPETFHYRVRYALPSSPPKISIITPSKDHYQILKTCLDSVFKLSTYENFEIIVSDNGTTDAETLNYYRQLESDLGDRFKLIKGFFPFNFGRQINAGAAQATGEYLLLLNDDVEVITPEWMEELLQLAQHEEVGAVGCKLLFPDDRTIQHGGVAVSPEFIAETEGQNLPEDSRAYIDVFNTVRETDAITAACLMIRKDKFDAVGGFDQVFAPNGFGDVEFCLKLREAKLSNVYTPYAKLFHYESKSRGVANEEFEIFHLKERYGAMLYSRYINPRVLAAGYKHVDTRFHTLDLNAKTMDHVKNVLMSELEWLQAGKRDAEGPASTRLVQGGV